MAKHRDGPLGKLKLKWDGECVKIDDCSSAPDGNEDMFDSLGTIHEFQDYLVANTPTSRTDIGLHRYEPAHPTWLPYSASLSLDPVVHP